MTEIDEYLPREIIAPEILSAIREAWSRATDSLHDTGQPALVREIIAGRILRLARNGELDPRKLCEEALKGLGIHSECEKATKH